MNTPPTASEVDSQQLMHSAHCCVGSMDTSSSSDGSPAASDATLVLEGQQFRDFVVGPGGVIDKAAFTAIWPRLRVLARCSPTDKYTIVRGAHTSPCQPESLAQHQMSAN